MNVDMITGTGGASQQANPIERIDAGRRAKESKGSEPQTSAQNTKIQPEELLDQINAVTQDGLYSVRFERDEGSSGLVVKIFDHATQEVIRQIPAEELLNFKATFEELVGNTVNTKG